MNISRVKLKFIGVAVVAALFGCGGGDSTAPRVATTITAVSPTANLTGTAGGAVGNPPSVVVNDQNGAAMPGAVVTFTIVSGNGLVSTPTVTTDANGIATVGTWTLGQTVGVNTMTASAGSAAPITFTANSTAGPAATITKFATADNQHYRAGMTVPVPPAVTVKDQYGNPVSGSVVTFAVASGGGVDGPNGAVTISATTDANGLAAVPSWTFNASTFTWILGQTPGANSLTATAGTLPAVTFSATGEASPPCTFAAHAFGSTSTGTLSYPGDCNDNFFSFIDLYTVTIPAMGMYLFNQSSTAFDSYLEMFQPDQTLVGFNDDFGTSTNSRLKVLVPAGDYVIGVTSFEPNKIGNYSLLSAATTLPVSNCEDVFAMRGVSTDQTLQTTDCLFNQFYSDDYAVYLKAGQTITVSMNSTAFDAVVELYSASTGALVSSNDNKDATTTNAQLTYTTSAEAIYIISATSKVSQTVGAYTLIIQ